MLYFGTLHIDWLAGNRLWEMDSKDSLCLLRGNIQTPDHIHLLSGGRWLIMGLSRSFQKVYSYGHNHQSSGFHSQNAL
jgi:hypothetical protein